MDCSGIGTVYVHLFTCETLIKLLERSDWKRYWKESNECLGFKQCECRFILVFEITGEAAVTVSCRTGTG